MKDYATGATIYLKFGTVRPSTGASYALASGAVSVYKDNSTTQTTTGVTLTSNFDSLTGCNHVAIDTSADGSFYSSGSEFQLILTAGTVDSISVVGQVVGEFSLGKTSALRPTVAGRTLDVSAGGEAGIDWANVGSPTTTVGLTNTTISTGQAVASVTGSVGSVTAAVTLPTIPTDWITADGVAASAISEIQSGLSTLTASGVRTAIGMASANLDTQLGLLATASDLGGLITTVGVAGAGLTEAGGTGDQFTAIPWNADWDTEVQSECADALTAYDPPTKAEQDAAFTEIKGAGWSSSTDTLEKIKVDTAVARSAGVVTIGVISNAGTAVESYVYGGQTVTFAGLDASGNRSGVTVS